MRVPRAIAIAAACVTLPLLNLIVGTACHEVIGHGMTGLLCGGRIRFVEILGFEVWPRPTWLGWPDAYGHCHIQAIPTHTGELAMRLGGSLSTWLVSVLAITALWVRHWRGLPRLALVCLGTWWIDLLTYTLPSWGFRRSILWACRAPCFKR